MQEKNHWKIKMVTRSSKNKSISLIEQAMNQLHVGIKHSSPSSSGNLSEEFDLWEETIESASINLNSIIKKCCHTSIAPAVKYLS